MIKDENYSVWYPLYENIFGTFCTERRQFDTEEEADKFIQDLLNDESKQIWKVVKTAQTIYYPKAERK